jgi:hypothetical protein
LNIRTTAGGNLDVTGGWAKAFFSRINGPVEAPGLIEMSCGDLVALLDASGLPPELPDNLNRPHRISYTGPIAGDSQRIVGTLARHLINLPALK